MKKRIGIFSIIFVVLTLTSCGNNEPIEPLDASSSVNSAQAQKPAQIVDGELQSLKWGSAITKDGYYLMDPVSNSDNSTNIMYIDFQSKSEIHLCASANCTHTGPECEGRLPASGGGSRPLIISNQLVLAFPGAPYFNDELGEASFPKIMTMGMDGKDKKVITTFKAAQEIFEPYITDGENLYCTLETTEANELKSEIIKINLETGDWIPVYELNVEQGEQVIDAYGSNFIISGVGQSLDETLAQGTVTSVFFKLNVSTGEKETIFSPESGDTLRIFQGKELYYFSLSENALHCLDCETLTDKIVCESVFEDGTALNLVEFLDCRDGYALFGQTSEDFEDFSMIKVNLSTGEKSEFNLTSTNLMGTVRPVQVLSKIPGTEQYLVKIGEKSVEEESQQPDGTSMYVTTARDIYAIINASDYWASNPAYSVIEFAF